MKQSVHRGAGVSGVSKVMRVVCETGQETHTHTKKKIIIIIIIIIIPGGEIRDTWIVRETVIILTVIAGQYRYTKQLLSLEGMAADDQRKLRWVCAR